MSVAPPSHCVTGFARRSAQTIGNFWVDLTRCVLYILLPISVVVGLVLLYAVLLIVLNLAVDIAYMMLDRRVKYE